MSTSGIIFIVLGIFTILAGSVSNLSQKSRRGRRLEMLFGETGSRIFYFILGSALIAVSFFI